MPLILEEHFQSSLCSPRGEAGQASEPFLNCLQSCELRALKEQTPLPCSPPGRLHTEECKELFCELKALAACFVKRGSVWSQCECLVLWMRNGSQVKELVTATKNKGWSRGRDGVRRSLMFDEFSSFPFSPSWAWQALFDSQSHCSNSYEILLLQHLPGPRHLLAALLCRAPLTAFLPAAGCSL